MKPTHFFLLLFILSFAFHTSCYSQKKIDKKLIGDWVSDQERYIISFTDSTVGFYDWGDFEEYYTHSDTIYYNQRDIVKRDYSYRDSAKWQPRLKRTIKNNIDTLGRYVVTKDSLKLYRSKELFFYFDSNTFIRKFRKVKPKHNIKFDSIFVKTSFCKGICQAMEIKLLSSGEFFFKGIGCTDVLGSYSATLPKKMIRLLQSKLNQLDLYSYESNYCAGHTDGQSKDLILYHNNKSKRLYIYGHGNEPLEANIVFHYLMELHRWVELKKSDKEFKFETIEKLYALPSTYEVIDEYEEEKQELLHLIKNCIYSPVIQEIIEVDTSSHLPFFIHTYKEHHHINFNSPKVKLFQRPVLFIDYETANLYALNDMSIEPGLEFNTYEINDDTCTINLRFNSKDYIATATRVNKEWKIKTIVETN